MSSEKGSKCSMLPRPRSTVTSRARELRNQTWKAGETVSKTSSNTPRISSSLANNMLPEMNIQRSKGPSLHVESVKPSLKHKENTFVTNIEVDQKNMIEAETIPPLQPENLKFISGGGDEEEAYTMKKSEFQSLKKDLDERQTKIIEVYSYLKELHSKLVGNGRDLDHMEPVLQLLDVGGWSASDLRQFASRIAGGCGEVTTPIGDGLEMPKKICELPVQLIGLCHEILMKRSAIVDTLQQTELGELHFVSKIHEWKAEDDGLKSLLGTISQQTEKNASSVANSVSELVHQAMNRNSKYIQFKEQNAQLKKQLENMEKELQQSQINAGTGLKTGNKLGLGKQPNHDSKKMETDGQDNITKKHHECELRMYRSRIRDLERDLKDMEAKFTQKSATLQSTESTVKHQELHHESRLRILHDNLRTTEKKMSGVSKQKDVLEAKVQELVQLLEKTKLEGADTISNEEHIKQICDLQQKLEDQKLQNASTVKDLEDAGKNMEKLEKKTRCILELIQKRGFSKQRCEDETVKDLLKAEEDLKNIKQDNARLLEEYSVMEKEKKILESEIKSKENTINQLRSELNTLNAELNASKGKNKFYENLQHGSNESGSLSGHQQQLQEIVYLRDNLANMDEQNERLATELDGKRSIIDQKEKAFNEQLKTLNVRDELIKMLQNKDVEQAQYISFKENEIEKANKFAVAKVEEVEKLESMLATKQEEMASLVEVTKLMEQNFQKCQRHRIKHEKTIGLLEQEVESLKNTQKRKFLFF